MKNNSLLVIFITGTIGAGKNTAVDFLKEKGFLHLSVRGFLTEILAAKDLPADRDNMTKLANDLRRKNGPAYIIETLYEDSLLSPKNVVIESVRNVGEIQFLRSKPNAHLLAVDAEQQTRWQRILKRGSSTDHVSWEKFVEQEKAESNGNDPWVQNIPACIKAADCVVYNDGTVSELCHQVVDFLRTISEKELA